VLAKELSFKVYGHAHPRVASQLKPYYEEAGIEFISSFDDVMDRADLYVCDNSSTMYEFASLGRPVVTLNAPWYRRDTNHGLRFWDYADMGTVVNEPEELVPAISSALLSTPEQTAKRQRAVSAVYVATDGRAGERGATALLSLG
jgi:UDP-N-acetylglucosamine:LPS N-acetylglucosamine transferase